MVALSTWWQRSFITSLYDFYLDIRSMWLIPYPWVHGDHDNIGDTAKAANYRHYRAKEMPTSDSVHPASEKLATCTPLLYTIACECICRVCVHVCLYVCVWVSSWVCVLVRARVLGIDNLVCPDKRISSMEPTKEHWIGSDPETDEDIWLLEVYDLGLVHGIWSVDIFATSTGPHSVFDGRQVQRRTSWFVILWT